ncbi:unnamed protein product [Lactuca saligna]|uniref:BED-type domain-containing protein n=1 Tax=Lactuca saligna TaxID=75948 RepID=A0AA36E238_LACSI|nr:unnamed protein product [Lactuca saligna]
MFHLEALRDEVRLLKEDEAMLENKVADTYHLEEKLLVFKGVRKLKSNLGESVLKNTDLQASVSSLIVQFDKKIDMKRAKLDKTHNTKKAKLNKTDTHSATVAPQDVELEEEADDIDVVEVDVKVEGEEDHVKMERERWSKVWKYYTRLPIGADGRERAECDKCKKRYICETKNGTGSLRNHIAKCPRRDKSDIAQFSFAKSGGSISINSTVFKPERFRELISEAIVKHDLPFRFVEYEGIREIFSYLNEKVTTITRNTAKEDVLNLFKREKGKLKKLFELLPGRISLTADLWSSINTDGFLCVTSHFIDEEWKLQKRILNFQYMPPPHNGVCLTETISTLLTNWGIDKKLFTITLDNAASNDTFVNLLKGQLCNEGALHSNGDYFHVRCCAHVLNLVVQDGLKAIDEGIVKIRESIKYVKGSSVRKRNFLNCVKQVNLNPNKGLRQDVPTRWNATFLMIESALFYRRAFFRLALSDSNYLDCPSNEEWGKLEKIFKFLEVFYEVTCIFSGNKYCTANLYFPSVSTVERTLKEEIESSDTFIKIMACKMYEKFSKYWSEYSPILAMAAVLDPRYKMQYVEFTYKKLYGSSFREHSDCIREKLHDLFGEYVIESPMAYRASTISTSDSSKSVYKKKDDTTLSKSTREMLQEFTVYETKEFALSQKSQLEMYLDEPRSDITEDINVLSFWKAHQYRYPELASMARDILSIPVSTVASESAFSNGGRILDQYRSSLKHENVEALICAKDWLFGIKGDEELCLQDLTEDVMKFDNNANGTHEEMESQA